MPGTRGKVIWEVAGWEEGWDGRRRVGDWEGDGQGG